MHAFRMWTVRTSSSWFKSRSYTVQIHLPPCNPPMAWSDTETKVGHLSAFETCTAFAFHVALEAIAKHLERPAYDLLG